MINNDPKPTLETSNTMKEVVFGIGDASIIFDVLRSKLYSNPLQSVCREITCNARDTMIAAGKPNEPIQITLPNAIEPTLKIKDTGEGISPERIENIFVMFGSSTKRDTNDQVGFFGLGSKSIGSITDTYTIETNYNGTKYNYAFALDETRLGKLLKLNEAPTDDINGTEITIPIKSSDFIAVKTSVEFACRHWEPKPIIKGGQLKWCTPSWILEGTNWKVATSTTAYSKSIKLVIAQIEYPLAVQELPNQQNLDFFYATNGDCFLYFKTGELTLAANREAVHLDKSTIDKITQRAKDANKELTATIKSKIDTCTSLKEAFVAYTKLSTTYSNLKKMEWNNIELSTSLYVPGMVEWSKSWAYSASNSYIYFDDRGRDLPIYINDLCEKALTKKQISKLFDIEDEHNKKPDCVRIINSSTYDAEKWKETLDKKVQNLHLEELGATYLSEVISLDPEKVLKPRMTVFKFAPIENKFKRVSYDDYLKDKSTKALCTLYKSTYGHCTRYTKYKNRALSGKHINYLLNNSKTIAIYGLDEAVKPAKIKQFFKGCKKFDNMVDEQIGDDAKDVVLRYRAYQRFADGISVEITELRDMKDELGDDVKAIFKQMAEQQTYINENVNAVNAYQELMGVIQTYEVDEWINKHSDVMNYNDEMNKILVRYPILLSISRYGWSDNMTAIVEYIKLIDERDKKAKTKKVAKNLEQLGKIEPIHSI